MGRKRIFLFLVIFSGLACTGIAQDLRVMKKGLGMGTITSSPAGINCGSDCDETYALGTVVTLTATPAAGSTFAGWELDGTGTTNRVVTISGNHLVRAVFNLSAPIAVITNFTPTGIQSYLNNPSNAHITTPARFVAALPLEYKQNWILMTRSESLQTGTAETPRLLLPSADAEKVFTIGLATNSSYPGSHPNAVEYMQWDAATKNFRFHEIVLDTVPAMGVFSARSRGVSIDDSKCSKCHSTQNVLNRSSFPGTTGITPGTVQFKYKPNWDTYDSWAGMMPLNRDRIYQGSVEAAAFRKFFNLWTWRTNDTVRQTVEQLALQPPGVPAAHVITRQNGGPYDGHIGFAFDAGFPVLSEPAPTGSLPSITTNYSFDGAAGTGPATTVVRGGSFVTLHHSLTPTNDEGRAVQLFDLMGGADGTLNQQRIADELINHQFATGSVPIDVRPIALALSRGLLRVNTAMNMVESIPTVPPLTVSLAFFDARVGMSINALVTDTQNREYSMPRRKADFQKLNVDRTGDVYLDFTPPPGRKSKWAGGPIWGRNFFWHQHRHEQAPSGGVPAVYRRGFSGPHRDGRYLCGSRTFH